MSKQRQLEIIDLIGSALMLYILGLITIVWAVGAGVRKLLRWRP